MKLGLRPQDDDSSGVERSDSTALVVTAEEGRGGEYGSIQHQQHGQEQQSKPGDVLRQEISPPTPPMADTSPFPLAHVLILAICMTLNMYALVNLFPYVGTLVKTLLKLETTNEVGFYAGYVASSFTFGRFLSGYVWGSATDIIGRKPVIIIGLLSITIFSMIFGMSDTYSMAITTRFILGLTNGIMPALRTSLSEVCGPEHVVLGKQRTRAISMVIGTGIGGLLAQPALHYPTFFSPTGLFAMYPFLLPNLVGAVLSVFALFLVIFYLPETKDYNKRRFSKDSVRTASTDPRRSPSASPGRSSRKNCGSPTSAINSTNPAESPNLHLQQQQQQQRGGQKKLPYGADIDRREKGEGARLYQRLSQEPLAGDAAFPASAAAKTTDGSKSSTCATDELSASEHGDEEQGLFGPGGLLARPHVKLVLFLGCIIATLAIGFDEVYPLYALSTPSVGGLGWNTVQIGQVMVMAGLLLAVCQLVLFPPFIKMVGITYFQRLGCGVGVAAFLAVPGLTSIGWDYDSLFSLSVVANNLIMCSLGSISLALSLGSTTLVPSRMRGKLGGLYNTAESLGRFCGPVGYATTYAWSVSPSTLEAFGGWVDYHLVFCASALALVVVGVMAWRTLTVENLMSEELDRADVDVVNPTDKTVPSSS
ncbi:unnamed protein product, partial [Ectocarpus sp. 6 AP-2014]